MLGHHPYTTKTKIYDRLVAPYTLPQFEQTEAMKLGVFLEKHIARYAAQRMGLKLRAATKTIEYPGDVNLCATPDYYVLKQRMLVEVKLSSILYGWTPDDIHPHYEYQARAQLACTNRDVCFVVALVGASFYTVPIVRDMEKEAVLLETVRKFFEDHVIPGIRPVEEVVETRLKIASVTGA